MDIYLLALNFIVADKLMGGVPSKLIEHIVINNVVSLTWWSASKLLYGVGYLAMLPFTSTKINDKAITPLNNNTVDLIVNSQVQLNSDWEIVNKDESTVIFTNNKNGEQLIITKKEVDDMIVITKE